MGLQSAPFASLAPSPGPYWRRVFCPAASPLSLRSAPFASLALSPGPYWRRIFCPAATLLSVLNTQCFLFFCVPWEVALRDIATSLSAQKDPTRALNSYSGVAAKGASL